MKATKNVVENVPVAIVETVVKTKAIKKIAEVETKNAVSETIAEMIEAKKKRKTDSKKLFFLNENLYSISNKKLNAAKLIFKNDEVSLQACVISAATKVKLSKNLFFIENSLRTISYKQLSAAKLIFKNDENALNDYIALNSKEIKISKIF